jgi:poly-gamma-glutamate synthesis protein (capsule biosynthesis protein)
MRKTRDIYSDVFTKTVEGGEVAAAWVKEKCFSTHKATRISVSCLLAVILLIQGVAAGTQISKLPIAPFSFLSAGGGGDVSGSDLPLEEAPVYYELIGGKKENLGPPAVLPRVINTASTLSSDFIPPDLTKIDGTVKGTKGIQLQKHVLDAYKRMYDEIKALGMEVSVISGYRSYSKQQTNFDAKAKTYGVEGAKKIVAYPGTSEHQYGACMDLSTDGTCQNNFAELPVGKWVKENCVRFGFVIRYKKDKQDITGIMYEPWHIRYVGTEHAMAMEQMNMCLEEYFEYLKQQSKDNYVVELDASGTAPEVKEKPEMYKFYATAYKRILPADGEYAPGIDSFLNYEHEQMKEDEIIMSFVGDCTLGTWPEAKKDANFNTVYENSGSPTYSFDMVKGFFMNDDYTYINLETTLTNSGDKLPDKAFNFKGSPDLAEYLLAPSYVEGCNFANNHSFDWKQTGYDETIKAVTEAGMDIGDEKLPIIKKIGDIEVVLLSGNYIWPAGLPQKYGDDLTNFLIEEIRKYKKPDNIVIVNAHWGFELQNDANSDQAEPARKFVDAGADMVIGHHPHTIQGAELYKGKYIFYSIGNFAFGGKATTSAASRMGMIVRPRFALRDGKAECTGVLVVPCSTTSSTPKSTNNYQPIPLFGEEARFLKDEFLSYSGKMVHGIDDIDCPTIELAGISDDSMDMDMEDTAGDDAAA